jgi:predicted anti-sigma-YlaC factor YlaD
VRVLPASVACERVREQLSRELDGELSQLERKMVATHLGRCANCRAFGETVRRFTEDLRAAPPELLQRPVVVHLPRRISLTGARVGVAAAVAFAALGLASQLGAPWSQRTGSSPAVTNANFFNTSWTPERELAEIDAALERQRNLSRPGPMSAI